MKKNLPLILSTALATNLLWFGIALCWFWSCTSSGPVNQSTVYYTNDVVMLAVSSPSAHKYRFAVEEMGQNPTNLVVTNSLQLTRYAHDGQEFRITVRKAFHPISRGERSPNAQHAPWISFSSDEYPQSTPLEFSSAAS